MRAAAHALSYSFPSSSFTQYTPLCQPFYNHYCVYPGKGTTFGRGVGPRVIYHKKYSVGFLDNAKGEDLCWGVNFCRSGFNWILEQPVCKDSELRLLVRE